jgi:IS5 family transposase
MAARDALAHAAIASEIAAMIEARRLQRRFGDGFVAETVADLHESWMSHADRILNDDVLLAAVYEALARRHPKSRTRGRRGAPAEMVLRLLVLKHLRNWSYATLEREVRGNLVYRDFTRIGGGKVPDAKTMGRWGVALGPAVIEQLHGRLIAIAREQEVVEGRRMRVDTTVVETNIHYPTDSSLLGDGVRVLTRAMKKVTAIAGIRFDPEARNVRHTHVEPSEDRRTWRVQQVLVDPALHNDWMAEFEVDLAVSREANQPVLWLRGIGPIA